MDLYHQLSTLSPSKQNVPIFSLIGSKQLLTTHQRLVTETTEQSEHSPGIDELQAVSLTFVNDLDVPEVQVLLQDIQQQDEYETDSDTERDHEVYFEVVSKTCMTRSGRAVRTFLRLDL